MVNGWLVAVAGLVTGIVLESVFEFTFSVVLWLVLLALGIALIWKRAHSVSPFPLVFFLSIFLLCSALGLLRTQYFEKQFDNALHAEVGEEITIEGLVIADPDTRTNQQLLTVTYEDERLLVSTDRSLPVSYGDTVLVNGRLELPESFTTELGRTFDYATYLKAKRIEYRISFAEVEIIATGGGNPILRFLFTQKHRLLTALDQVLTEPAGSLADGLLLGLNQGLGEQLEQDFRRSGIVHIVVLSGYNVMLVVTFVLFILSFVLPRPARLLVGLLAISAFALIVGLSATVMRASVMAGLLLIAQSLGRTYAVLQALVLAGVVMILINPYLLLFDIGFQLSFMATLGLVAALPWLTDESHFEIMASSKGYVVATVATQIAVLPLLIYHIGEVSLVAVLVNLLVLPVVPVAMLGAFLSAVLWYLVPAAALIVGYLTQLVLNYIIAVASTLAAFPFATMQFEAVSVWWVPVLYAALAGLYWWVRNHGQRTVATDDLVDWEIVEEMEVIPKVGVDTTVSAPTDDVPPKWFR